MQLVRRCHRGQWLSTAARQSDTATATVRKNLARSPRQLEVEQQNYFDLEPDLVRAMVGHANRSNKRMARPP